MKYLSYSIVILLLVVVYISCVTPESVYDRLNSWISASENELLRAWGVPDDQYDADNGAKYLRYDVVVTTNYTSYRTGNEFFSFGVANSDEYVCTITFEVNQSLVSSAQLTASRSGSGSAYCRRIYVRSRARPR